MNYLFLCNWDVGELQYATCFCVTGMSGSCSELFVSV